MEQSGFQNGLFYSKWVKTCKTTCMAPRQTPGFTLNKNRCRNITHCYSFIMRVLLAFPPHTVQPKNQHHLNSWVAYHDSFLLWGMGGGRLGRFTDRAVSLRTAWMTELPHKTWQLLTPTPRCVSTCLSFIGVNHGCVFACQAADLPAQDMGCVFSLAQNVFLCFSASSILHVWVFICYIWMHMVYHWTLRPC